MYLPLLVGAFILPMRWAVALGVLTPLLSASLTGMPSWLTPVPIWMALELGFMAFMCQLLGRKLPVPWALAFSLLLGRCLHAGLVLASVQLLALTPQPTANVQLLEKLLSMAPWLSAWPGLLLALTSSVFALPGLVLAMLVVPTGVAALRRWDMRLETLK